MKRDFLTYLKEAWNPDLHPEDFIKNHPTLDLTNGDINISLTYDEKKKKYVGTIFNDNGDKETKSFKFSEIKNLKKNGWKETPENIFNEFGLTTTQYRAQKGLAVDLRRMDDVARAKSLAADGLGPTAIAKKMSEEYGTKINESTVRSLLNEEREKKMMQAKNTADFIRNQVKAHGIIDIGAGTEIDLNVSKEKLNQAIEILKSEGYVVVNGGIPQVTNSGKQTITKVILQE